MVSDETEQLPAPATYRILVTPRSGGQRPAITAAAQQLGIAGLQGCREERLYFIQGRLNEGDLALIAGALLADPVTETIHVSRSETSDPGVFLFSDPPGTARPYVDVALLPGVTDAPADNLVRAARLLGVAGVQRAATGSRYHLQGDLSAADLQALANGVLANPVIQQVAVNQAIPPPFFPYQAADETVIHIPLIEADDETLLAISRERRLALSLAEMQAIQTYFREEEREPSDAELEMLAQTWSEHCVHKTFKAEIDYTGPEGITTRIRGLLNTYIRAATDKVDRPWVRSAFVDDAGIIEFTDRLDLAFKVETHNHPSALEPFGGANTGVGGVVRDVLGVSARPIANTDVLCFGPGDLPHEALPDGVLHPRRIADGVVAGIEDYGNKMGIPTVNGSIHYHGGYTANPLVYCGCLGVLPHGSHPTQVQPGDLIIAIGGRTGRDGLRGATFSSMEMDVETATTAGSAVQIGNPIQEKQVLEVILRAREEGLYNAITDCGAGGFSSSVGEMGEKVGARVQLQAAPLKYPGLQPWEIWLSEAQERMVLAVPPEKWERLLEICAGQDVEAVCIGTFSPTGRLSLYYGDRLVGDVAMSFLHDGIPNRVMTAAWSPPIGAPEPRTEQLDLPATLLALLAHPNIRSREDVVRLYDHEVQGGTAVKPLVGSANHGPSNGAVIVPQEAQGHTPPGKPLPGAVLTNGINPAYGALDPYAMAWAAVDEALRNAVAVGADPERIAILDNFCWGNPNLPDRLGALVRCAQGCHDAAVAFRTPFISGKDSLNNEYTGADGEKHAIPGTILISAVGIVPDVHRTATMDLKAAALGPGTLFVLGATRSELGGSHLALLQEAGGGTVPQPETAAPAIFATLHDAIADGLVRAVHDCSEGGLGVALAEMALAGGSGLTVDLDLLPVSSAALNPATRLFSESLSRFVVEVSTGSAATFADRCRSAGIPFAEVGASGGARFQVRSGDAVLIDLSPPQLLNAWRGHIAAAQPLVEHPDPTPAPPPTAPTPLTGRPRVLVLHANGTNRDRDAALACEIAGGDPEIVHLNQLLAGERRLSAYQMLVLPGGFSYGDDLGAAVLWATDLRYRLHDALRGFVAAGRPVLGICNGFQVLVKAGILPGWQQGGARTVTLTYNASQRFECRWTTLTPNPASPSLFTAGLEAPIYCPVAHGEGRLAATPEAVERLEAQQLVALRYAVAPAGDAYPANPNGSVNHIAGLCNPAGNVLGLMPHPEDHIFPWQHPQRHRGGQGLSGLALFANGIRSA